MSDMSRDRDDYLDDHYGTIQEARQQEEDYWRDQDQQSADDNNTIQGEEE